MLEIVKAVSYNAHRQSDVMEIVFRLRRADAIRHRMVLITEDRQLKGLNLKSTVRDNITMSPALEEMTK